MRVLLLSAYDAQSHAQWRHSLIQMFPHWEWVSLCLPARYFAWRVRGNSLSFAFGEHAHILQQPYDLVIATSMTDLSALRGFVPAIAQIPTLVYFHENQFAYPTSAQMQPSVEPQVLNVYSALAADYVVFNSHFNRDTFLQGAAALLKKLPDQVPSGLIARLEERSCVVPVPLNTIVPHAIDHTEVAWASQAQTLRIVWAARWEFDKAPELLHAILHELDQRHIDFRLALLGQRFRHTPPIFDEIIEHYAQYIDHQGYAKNQATYWGWLASADYVLSTALHEFQGLAVLEAVSLGCRPLLPHRQVYPEYFSAPYLYSVTGDLKQQAANAVDQLMALQNSKQPIEPELMGFTVDHLHSAYLDVFAAAQRFHISP